MYLRLRRERVARPDLGEGAGQRFDKLLSVGLGATADGVEKD